jgi:hypothetical protein
MTISPNTQAIYWRNFVSRNFLSTLVGNPDSGIEFIPNSDRLQENGTLGCTPHHPE